MAVKNYKGNNVVKFLNHTATAILIVMIFMGIFMTTNAFAATDNYTGDCGDSVEFDYDPSTNTLHISGQGAVEGYKIADRPWNSYISDIESIIIDEGITEIGQFAFDGATNLISVQLPDSLEILEWDSFYNCSSLEEIELGPNVWEIGAGAFGECLSLRKISFCESVTYIGLGALDYSCVELVKVSYCGTEESWEKTSFSDYSDRVRLSEIIEFTEPEYTTETEWTNSCIGTKTVKCKKCGYTVVSDITEHNSITDELVKTDTGAYYSQYCKDCGEVFDEYYSYVFYYDGEIIKSGLREKSQSLLIQDYEDDDGYVVKNWISSDGETYSYPDVYLKRENVELYALIEKCSYCNANGKIATNYRECPQCYGAASSSTTVSCTVCSGLGKIGKNTYVRCPVYDFWHTVTPDGYTKGQWDALCPNCHGKFVVLASTGSTCTKCHGKGYIVKSSICSLCNGAGHIYDYEACTYCGGDNIICDNGHTEVRDAAVEPTCISDGKSEGSHCSVCGLILQVQKTLYRTGHDWGDGVIVSPTCTEDGYVAYTCVNCGESKIQTTTSATGHTYGEWITVKEPTSTSVGEQIRTCGICGETESRDMAALGILTPDTQAMGTPTTVTSTTKIQISEKLKTEEHIKEETVKSSTFELITVDSVKTSNVSGGVKVKWTKVTNAAGYIVYRKLSGAKNWTKIKTISKPNVISYIDKKAKFGKTYKYAVKAYCKCNGKTVYSSAKSSSNIRYLKAPTKVIARKKSSGIKVTWKKTTGAKGYIVYRKTGSGKWVKVKTIKKANTVTYLDKKTKKGKKYTYKVKAYYGKSYSVAKMGRTVKR